MKIKQLICIGAMTMFVSLAGSALAQDAHKNPRQRRLDRKETVNTSKQERIRERNPKGLGRHDNRVTRRGDRIDRKQRRTDRRVKHRRGNQNG